MGYDRGDSFTLDFLNQIEFHLVQNRKENCHHDQIPFNLKGNGNIVFSVFSVFLAWPLWTEIDFLCMLNWKHYHCFYNIQFVLAPKKLQQSAPILALLFNKLNFACIVKLKGIWLSVQYSIHLETKQTSTSFSVNPQDN